MTVTFKHYFPLQIPSVLNQRHFLRNAGQNKMHISHIAMLGIALLALWVI